jgi:hypothetical protein
MKYDKNRGKLIRNRSEIRGSGTRFHTRTRGEGTMDGDGWWLAILVVLASESIKMTIIERYDNSI